MPPIKRIAYQRVPRTVAHASMEANQLAQRLDAMHTTDRVSYAELSDLVGVDVQERRDLLATARKIVQETSGKVFAPEIGIGLVCLNDVGKVGLADDRTQRTQRYATQTQSILVTVDIGQLSPMEKHRHLALQSLTAGVQVLTHAKTVQQVAAGEPLPALPWNPTAHADVFKT